VVAATALLMPSAVAAGALSLQSAPAGAAQRAAQQPRVFNDAGMIGFGSVNTAAPPMPQPLNSPVFTGAASPDGNGYVLASADGGVFAFGDANFEGSLGSLALNGPVVAMATTPDGRGYRLGAMDGGVFAFGDAGFYGSMGAVRLNQPVVGMASTPDGRGYWLVAADGGIFSFGDANFWGSLGNLRLNQPVVGMASTRDGRGYWLVAADGGIFSFGDANFWGSAGNENLPDPVVGMVASPDDRGYLMATQNGVVLPFGDAPSYGGLNLDPTATQISAIVGNNHGNGYWLLDPQAWLYTFHNNAPEGAFPESATIAGIASSQIEPDPAAAQGAYCNPYGPCEAWCALFATWVWETAGIPIPRYAFTGDIWYWSAAHGLDLPPWATPDIGDAVLYGTGPQNVLTSVHVAIVVESWPDGALITVGGDSGPGRFGALSTNLDGPFLPSHAADYGGMPIYGYSQP
jgi:hypothetical protein